MGSGVPLYAQTATPSGGAASSERIRNVDTPRGAAAFDRGQAAWGRGDFDAAEAQFRDALEQGGLPRKDVLKAHVYLGSARAVLGKNDAAMGSFRIAATLDPAFTVPPEAGKKAVHLAETARKQRSQPLSIRADVPSSVDPGRPFRVVVSVSPLGSPAPRGAAGNGPVVARVGLQVSDFSATGGSAFKTEQAPNARLSIDVPAKAAVAGASLSIRVSGLDARGNELVASEAQVHVEPEVQGPVLLPPSAVAPTPGKNTSKSASVDLAGRTGGSRGEPADHGSSKGGFWSSPWPYIIGGAVLAGAGAGAYFLLRPVDNVTVTPVQVQAIR